MALGFLALDIVYFLLLSGVFLAAAQAAFSVYALVGTGPLALLAATAAAFLTWVGIVLLLAWLSPKPREGKYLMMKEKHFFYWSLQFLLRRLLQLQPIWIILQQSNLLRFLSLRAFGAKTSLAASMSSDVVALDPALLSFGPGSIVGAQSLLTGHFVHNKKLVLARTHVGDNSLVAARCVLSPGVYIGNNVNVLADVVIGPYSRIEDGAILKARCSVSNHCHIGKNAVIAEFSYLPPNTVVPEGGKYPPEASAQ